MVNQELRDALLALARRDTETRSRLASEEKLYGDYAAEMQDVHRENAKRLAEITAIFGWPGISLVGLQGAQAAWLIAQHAICTPDLQRQFLVLLTKAAEAGDVPKKQVAFLTDRIRFNESKPQVYGTVLDWNEEGELSCEVEDPANLDIRRKEVDLPTFREDLETHREEVKSEGGRPPANFTEYKRKQKEWAASVGWIVQ